MAARIASKSRAKISTLDLSSSAQQGRSASSPNSALQATSPLNSSTLNATSPTAATTATPIVATTTTTNSPTPSTTPICWCNPTACIRLVVRVRACVCAWNGMRA
ncbi:unnamed protein product [Closterium sp. NIES-54]